MASKTMKMFLILAVALMLVTSTVLAETETVDEENTPDEVEEDNYKMKGHKWCCGGYWHDGSCRHWCKKQQTYCCGGWYNHGRTCRKWCHP